MKFPLDFSVVLRWMPVPTGGPYRCMRSARIIGLLGIVLAALLLQACSAVKIAYNQAPQLGYWYLDSYFDFTGAQSLQVKADLVQLQAWHRQTQLPAYITTLQKLQQQMHGSMSTDSACALYEDVRQKLIAISDQAEPAVLAFVPTLNTGQLAQLERRFGKLNAEYRDDYLDGTPQDLHEKRQKKIVGRLEMLYGDLEKKQVAMIAERVAQSRFDAQMFYAETSRRQRDILQTLRTLIATQAQPEAARVAMRGLIERALHSPDAVYWDYQEKLTREGCAIFADLHNGTTPAQRNKAVETLDAYIKDFKALNAQKS